MFVPSWVSPRFLHSCSPVRSSRSCSFGERSDLRTVPSGRTGAPIGITVAGQRWLYGSPEDMHVDVWGPRTGKTTFRAIPAILSAPGAVIVTSNKRDVLDATRDVRA